MNPFDLLPEKISELIHELSVLPFNDMHYEGPVTSPMVLTNYTVWMIIALLVVVVLFVIAGNAEKKRLALAASTGKVSDLTPNNRLVAVLEMGVEFVRNTAINVIGEKEGPKYTAFLGSFFFLILVSNLFGLVPGGKTIGGAFGGAVGLALVVWVVFIGVGIKNQGGLGYLVSLVPAGVRNMSMGARIGLGGFLFILEFFSTIILRPFTLSVRLFANMYAGHIILGVFAALVGLLFPFGIEGASMTIGGGIGGVLSLVFLILMYAFELFVAFMQAYIFTILTAVYIQGSEHAH